mmetsp:Transcript_17268/g.15577  ORF Transcript_17268/g.15577 Transcript_17268/m.15577 type:complete len:216 (+) Transcript_17268:29-676(+)
MIRLKKKVEEADTNTSISNELNEKITDNSTSANQSSGFKLLGLEGKSIRKGEAKSSGKKKTPGEIRIQKDIADLDGGAVAKVDFPNTNDLTKFNVKVTPDSGCWNGATYDFSFAIPALYPHEPPKVTCHTKIYHPNINLEGNVCLNILRDEWKPVLDINAVIYGLIYLFYEPNPDDPLNSEAAELYRNDKEQFKRVVRRTLQGNSHAGITFPKLI